ncbi:hypothetical protein LN650_18250 [Klebsiella pneumoniae subsp. pneumoniae]|nr:hypothetical protein [Klebsiella pneumoniae subsp. pneumoniae]
MSGCDQLVAMRLYMDERLIVSTRQRKVLALDDVLGDLKEGNGPDGRRQLAGGGMRCVDRSCQRVYRTTARSHYRPGRRPARSAGAAAGISRAAA